ncbi:DNA processing protein [Falsibacillus pallidus]|uniref:DNA processing protein n=2 Tax=Falsibacillus pallidus TaxID=493781 RepID=A0A370GVB2_9BACI|nr:DNA processing protein [Falsibacillus pallidus]
MNPLKTKLTMLNHCAVISFRQLQRLLDDDPELRCLESRSVSYFQSKLQISSMKATELHRNLHTLPFEKLFHSYRLNQIYIIHFKDPQYPHLLKNIYNPPWLLYAIGNPSLLNERQLAVVGSRKVVEPSLMALSKLIPHLVSNGFVITSGLAKGVDKAAHTLTINHGGQTIGVLGSGFFHIYPQENRTLAENMKLNHLLLSEYPPHQKPNPWHFPMRNRIISGMASGTLVVQAAKKSGSLITAELALQEGREVFAVPGSMHLPEYEGSHFLIQQGAKLVMNGNDITEELTNFYS